MGNISDGIGIDSSGSAPVPPTPVFFHLAEFPNQSVPAGGAAVTWRLDQADIQLNSGEFTVNSVLERITFDEAGTYAVQVGGSIENNSALMASQMITTLRHYNSGGTLIQALGENDIRTLELQGSNISINSVVTVSATDYIDVETNSFNEAATIKSKTIAIQAVSALPESP